MKCANDARTLQYLWKNMETWNLPLNQSQTTPIEPVAESGTYSYNAATDDVVIDGETSKVVLLNANSMKIKSYVNQDGVTAEIYSEYNR